MNALNFKTGALVFAFGTLPIWSQVSRPVIDTPIVASAPTVSLPDHKIVPNDLLYVYIFNEPSVSKPSVRVAADGTIALPLIADRLKVEGMLAREVEVAVASKLVEEQILVRPSVTVNIVEYASRLISVVGDVKIPGQFNITAPITLLEALAKAGWTTPDAGSDLIYLRSPSEAPRKINILQLQANTDSTLNLVLNGGEVVSVPDAPKVWVTGNVTKPGAIPVKNPGDATVLKVVASAEGLTQYTNKTAYIYRADATGKRQEIEVPLRDMMHRKAQDIPLLVDDILLIPDDNGNKRRVLLQLLQTMGGAASSSSIIYGLHR